MPAATVAAAGGKEDPQKAVPAWPPDGSLHVKLDKFGSASA